MGYYVNPSNMSKEQWLQDNGIEVLTPGPFPEDDTVVVCLLDNGPFTAAAICYSKDELDQFAQRGRYEGEARTDRRHRQWFLVDKTKIAEVCPAVAARLK